MNLLKIILGLFVTVCLPHIPSHYLKWHTEADYAEQFANVVDGSASIYCEVNQTLSGIGKKEDVEASLPSLMDQIDKICAFQLEHWFYAGPILAESLNNPEIWMYLTPNEKDYWGIRIATFYRFPEVGKEFWQQLGRIRKDHYYDSPELKAACFLMAPHFVWRRNQFWAGLKGLPSQRWGKDSFDHIPLDLFPFFKTNLVELLRCGEAFFKTNKLERPENSTIGTPGATYLSGHILYGGNLIGYNFPWRIKNNPPTWKSFSSLGETPWSALNNADLSELLLAYPFLTKRKADDVAWLKKFSFTSCEIHLAGRDSVRSVLIYHHRAGDIYLLFGPDERCNGIFYQPLPSHKQERS